MAGPRSQQKHLLLSEPTSPLENFSQTCVCLSTHQDILVYNCEDCESSQLPFPIIADGNRELAVALGMLDPDEKDKDGMPLTARCASVQIQLRSFFSGISFHLGERCG